MNRNLSESRIFPNFSETYFKNRTMDFIVLIHTTWTPNNNLEILKTGGVAIVKIINEQTYSYTPASLKFTASCKLPGREELIFKVETEWIQNMLRKDRRLLSYLINVVSALEHKDIAYHHQEFGYIHNKRNMTLIHRILWDYKKKLPIQRHPFGDLEQRVYNLEKSTSNFKKRIQCIIQNGKKHSHMEHVAREMFKYTSRVKIFINDTYKDEQKIEAIHRLSRLWQVILKYLVEKDLFEDNWSTNVIIDNYISDIRNSRYFAKHENHFYIVDICEKHFFKEIKQYLVKRKNWSVYFNQEEQWGPLFIDRRVLLYNSPEQRIIDKHYNNAKDLYSNERQGRRYTLTWKKIRESLKTSFDIEHIPNNIYFDCFGNRIRGLPEDEELEQLDFEQLEQHS